MNTVKTVLELRAAVARARGEGKRIAFVPTMGNLHEGHVALVEKAGQRADFVVASIFVNPLQFGAGEDLDAYPRTPEADLGLLQAAGAALVWSPGVADLYPRGLGETTRVEVPVLSDLLCGVHRPGHFAGVATVVTKLFNIAQPDRAYFGEKDFQQLTIIRRMVSDLVQPVEVIGVPTVREADGLACSSRNVYLTAEERAAAVVVPRALEEAERLIVAGVTDARALEAGVAAFIRSEPLARPEVVAVRDPETLAEINTVGGKPVLLLLFVRFGGTKLLDNRVLGPQNAKKVA